MDIVGYKVVKMLIYHFSISGSKKDPKLQEIFHMEHIQETF